jgi:hypothetical protein
MKVKKKAKEFESQLVQLLASQGKVPKEVLSYVMAGVMIDMLIGDGDAGQGLNDAIESVVVAAADQGYRIRFVEVPPDRTIQ